MPGYIEFSRYQPVNIFVPLFPKFKTQSFNNTSMNSIFSNNSAVYYKPNSLSVGGVGTTKNWRRKYKHT